MMDEIFDDFDTFWAWYIATVKSYAPDCETQPYEKTQDAIPKLSDSELRLFLFKVKELQPLPKGVELIISDKEHTAYSFYAGGKVYIALPTITKLWLRFPSLLRGLVQHELGHILNGDVYINIVKSHSECSNCCMDIRINQNLNTETLNRINCCIFKFKNEQTEILNPETFFPKLGLPISLKGKLKWSDIHLAWHDIFGHNTYNISLNVGDYAISLKKINEHPAGTFGIVTAFDKLTGGYSVSVFHEKIQSAWRGENYILMKQLFQEMAGLSDHTDGAQILESKKLYDLTTGILGEALINKEDIIKAVPPKESDVKPLPGDFILTISEIKDINTGDVIKIGTYGQIVKALGYTVAEDESTESKPVFEIKPLTDEAALSFRNDDAAVLRELLAHSVITQASSFTGAWPSEFAVVEMPNDKKDENTDGIEEASMIQPPKVGDVVKSKVDGAWGVLQKINEDFTFEIKSVTEEVAKRILKAK